MPENSPPPRSAPREPLVIVSSNHGAIARAFSVGSKFTVNVFIVAASLKYLFS